MRKLERWLILVIMLVALLARLLPGPRMIDDAFITFRFARNIVHGIGSVYNSGERVLGTTTPFYTLLMADAASTFLIYHLGRRLSNSPLVVWAAAFW